MEHPEYNKRKKLLFIYNPLAGTRSVPKKLAAIVDTFTKGGYDVTCHPTQFKGDCMTVAAQACGYDLIVVSGGDGTLNEAVNGVMSSCADSPTGSVKPFGYIPSGSTNDFSRSVGIPASPEKAAAIIADGGSILHCDAGRLNERYFTYVAGFGTLAQVSYSTPQNAKNMLGFPAYIFEGIAALSTIESFNLSYASEERSGSGEYILGLVTNSLYVAGFPNVVEDVSLDDGLFEVLLVKKPKNAAQLHHIASSFLKKHLDGKYTECFKTSRITFTSDCDRPLSWTLDGENGGSHTVSTIENFKAALPIICHPKAQNKP